MLPETTYWIISSKWSRICAIEVETFFLGRKSSKDKQANLVVRNFAIFWNMYEILLMHSKLRSNDTIGHFFLHKQNLYCTSFVWMEFFLMFQINLYESDSNFPQLSYRYTHDCTQILQKKYVLNKKCRTRLLTILRHFLASLIKIYVTLIKINLYFKDWDSKIEKLDMTT